MLRRSPIKPGKGFRRPELPARQRPKLVPVTGATPAVMRRAEAANDMVAPISKRPREESKVFRDLARDQPCTLRVTGVCCHDWSTTVLAHSNSLSDNKGKGMKAHDHSGVFACYACHTWLDQGRATRDEKRVAFDAARQRMRALLQSIATAGRGWRRDAAKWALDGIVDQ